MNETPHKETALIFDLDGVLIHSMPMHVTAWERYLQKIGANVGNIDQSMHGKRNSELVRHWLGDDLSEDVIFEHGASKERLFRELMIEADLKMYRVPGLTEFLERHRDLPKAIGSNAEPENINFVLDGLALRPFFDVIVDGHQVDRPKPSPDIYLRAAELLKTPPEDCIVFEDSPTGVEAGIAAGMRVVGVETTPTHFKGVSLHIQNFLDPNLEPWLLANMTRGNIQINS